MCSQTHYLTPVVSFWTTCRIAELKVMLSVKYISRRFEDRICILCWRGFFLSNLWFSDFSQLFQLVWWLEFAINGIHKFLQVHVKISVPKGIKFVGHPGKHHLTRKKCVAPGEAKPTSIVLSFNELGLSNITGSIEIKIACCSRDLCKCFCSFLAEEGSYFPSTPKWARSFCFLPAELFGLDHFRVSAL